MNSIMRDDTRTERDLLGDVEVAANALYGAQTARAVANFPVDGARRLGDYPLLVRALIQVKKAAATANGATGRLEMPVVSAIRTAADRLLSERRFDQFPVHALHGGGGTSANMNANEVLANVAEECLGGRRGEYRFVHPSNHVNLNQSTNDVYPTACHLAIVGALEPLDGVLGRLRDSFRAQADRCAGDAHLARTCLQDAVATTFGDLFGAYAAVVERSRQRTAAAVERLNAVNLGGTIVGRPSDVPEAYFARVIEALRVETGRPAVRRADDLFDAAQHVDDMAAVSASLALLARGLVKIAKDLRLLSSGPEAGLGELSLPAVQPGSSIMPGKINPVIPEFVIQACCRVVGCDAACQMAVDHGELDLNVWESLAVVSVLDEMAFLESALTTFADRCVAGLVPNRDRNNQHVATLIPLLTRLMQAHGYSAVSDVCRRAGRDPEAIRDLLRREHLL